MQPHAPPSPAPAKNSCSAGASARARAAAAACRTVAAAAIARKTWARGYIRRSPLQSCAALSLAATTPDGFALIRDETIAENSRR
eukprot:2995748-Prymnesium_polylepis.2